MPTVISKLFRSTLEKAEKSGYSRETVSKIIVSSAVIGYAAKLALPEIKAYMNKKNNVNNCNNNLLIKNNNDIHSVENYDDDTCKNEEDLEKMKIIEAEKLLAEQKARTREKSPGLNLEFLLNLRRLIEIMIPSLICHETGLLFVHTLCLISRTFLSIYVAAMEGAIVKYIVRKDFKNFGWMLTKWFGIAIPATFINSMIRYLENKLALAFRTRLVNYGYGLYFKNQTYYRVSNLDGRIENADHRLVS